MTRASQKHIGFPSPPPHLVLSLRDNKKFKENPKRWGSCDEAPAVVALVYDKPPCWGLHVTFGIWIGPQAQFGSVAWKKNSKNVNQVANPSNYFFVSPFVVGWMGEAESRTWST